MKNLTYADLGWSDFFQRQGDAETLHAMRVTAVHRTEVEALSPTGAHRLSVPYSTGDLTPGDWVETDGKSTVTQTLTRQSSLKRGSAGAESQAQLIAANVRTLGIVTSCNADFNIARLERYLVVATDGGCLPLVILTKPDLTADADSYLRAARRLSPLVTAITINATDPEDVARLHPWCEAGETLALAGSSGVGKTTLRNALTGETVATQGIREDDAKGRHTTTSRALVRTRAGGWLIDTPGMRALPLTDATGGIETVFADIEDLATQCKFSDCAHDTEPGCAVRAALEAGALDAARLARWQKLKREDARHTETAHEHRTRMRAFNKVVKGAIDRKRHRRGDT